MFGAQTACFYSSANLANKNLLFAFAIALAAVIVLCSATNSSSATPIDEVKVLNQENVISPTEVELLADCNRSDFVTESLFSQRCPQDN